MTWENIDTPATSTLNGVYVKWAKAGQTIQGYVCYYSPQGAMKFKNDKSEPDRFGPFIDLELTVEGYSWNKQDMKWDTLPVGSHALVSATQKNLEAAILAAAPAVGDELRISVTEKLKTSRGAEYCVFAVAIDRGARQPTPAQAMVAATIPGTPTPPIPATPAPTPPLPTTADPWAANSQGESAPMPPAPAAPAAAVVAPDEECPF